MDREVLPASQYLQERLQERRARNMRPKRSRQTDVGPRISGLDDDLFLSEAAQTRRTTTRMYDSSPIVAASRMGSEAGGSGHGKRRLNGLRDVDEQLDRLHKQNFALKLELEHRREHTTKLQEQIEAMQAQVERAEQLEDEHTELLKINTQLVEELEKRDKAVQEATDIICDLEDKVADMSERHSNTRPSTANPDSGYAGTETHEPVPPSSPPELRLPKTPSVARPPPPSASAAAAKLNGVVNGPTPARMRREPSVLSLKKPSTHALRSVYLEAAQNLVPVRSFHSLLSKRDSRAEEHGLPDDVLESPRLSVLSESSFPSLYSPKQQDSPERFAWEVAGDGDSPEEAHSHFRQASINRVSRWISDGEVVEETPSKSNRISSPMSGGTERGMPTRPTDDDAHFQSLNDALSKANLAREESSYDLLQPVPYGKPSKTKTEKQRAQQHRQSAIGGTAFGEPLLPPTPDSASTHMLRASRSSMLGERSLLDTTPATVKGYDALEPGLRMAPKQLRSSIELNSAYVNNLRYRDILSGRQHGDSSSDEDDDLDLDARSETIKDHSLEYDGFPDGGSILMGTPSRFLKHGSPPAQEKLFDFNEISPKQATRSAPKRRQSSAEMALSPGKPSMNRAETSPTLFGTLGRLVTSGSRPPVDAMTSPRSQHSGSSGDRTVILTEEGPLSPDFTRSQSRSSRTSASPARGLRSKTQQLFRRMSNSNPQPEPRSPREKSPLPTLTSTPSSAYVNNMPKDVRRPSTSETKQAPTGSNAAQRAPGSREGRRPSLQARTQTEPTANRASSVASAMERKNPFKRSNSVKKTIDENVGTAGRGGVGSRSSSIRDAVGNARRPWR